MSKDLISTLRNKYEKILENLFIKGTRISVYDVLSWTSRWPEEIIADYPELNGSQINACLSFAANKRTKTFVCMTSFIKMFLSDLLARFRILNVSKKWRIKFGGMKADNEIFEYAKKGMISK